MSGKIAGLFFVSSLVASLLFSCASTSSSSQTGNNGAVSIAVPKRKSNEYFFSISDEVMSLAENGSPSSIRGLISKIHRPLKEEYSDRETVLLNICSAIMSIVWPSEPFSTDIPPADFYNPYTPIINSVQCGIYDTGSGSNDFFAIFLPNLIAVTSDMKNDYCESVMNGLEKCLQYKKDSVIVNYLMGVVYLRMENPEMALRYLNAAENDKGSTREILRAKARAHYSCKNYEQTVLLCEKILAGAPNDLVSMELLCRSLVELERWDEAMQYSIKLQQLDSENIEYGLLRAKILIATGEYLKASTLLDSCARVNPKHRDYLMLRGWLQKNWTKSVSASIETMRTAVDLYPEDMEVLLFAAQIASSVGNKIGNYTALDLVEKVLAKDEKNIAAMRLYVKEKILTGEYSDANDMCERLMDQGNKDMDLMCDYVDICNSLGKKSVAIEIASALYEENPDSEKVVQTYIKTLVAAEKNKEASELIENLLPGATNSMKSFLYYEKSLLVAGSEAALENLRTSLSFNARNVDTLYRMYRIYYSMQNWKMAQFYLKQVSSIKPQDVEIQNRIKELENLIGK